MQKLWLSIILTVFMLSSCSSTSTEYSVMTYNIRHGVGMDGVLDLNRIYAVIDAADPDIIILNEMDSGTERAFGVLQADSLGRQLNMFAIFGRSIDYDSGEYGNALLSKHPILDFTIIDLSTDSLLEGRSVFIATLNLGRDTLTVMGTHLGLDPEEQAEQVDRIITTLPPTPKLVLAGDFNFEPDSPSYENLRKHLADGILELVNVGEKTYPADEPSRRIDYIYLGSGIEAISIPDLKSAPTEVASDHLPQVLSFQIR